MTAISRMLLARALVIAALNLDSHSGSELTLLMRSVTTFSYSILFDVPDLSYGADD